MERRKVVGPPLSHNLSLRRTDAFGGKKQKWHKPSAAEESGIVAQDPPEEAPAPAPAPAPRVLPEFSGFGGEEEAPEPSDDLFEKPKRGASKGKRCAEAWCAQTLR